VLCTSVHTALACFSCSRKAGPFLVYIWIDLVSDDRPTLLRRVGVNEKAMYHARRWLAAPHPLSLAAELWLDPHLTCRASIPPLPTCVARSYLFARLMWLCVRPKLYRTTQRRRELPRRKGREKKGEGVNDEESHTPRAASCHDLAELDLPSGRVAPACVAVAGAEGCKFTLHCDTQNAPPPLRLHASGSFISDFFHPVPAGLRKTVAVEARRNMFTPRLLVASILAVIWAILLGSIFRAHSSARSSLVVGPR
jgi:hypothetical protein